MSLRRRSTLAVDKDAALWLKTTVGEDETSWPVGETNRERQQLISKAHLVLVIILSLTPWIPSLLLQIKLNGVQQQVQRSQEKNEAVFNQLTQLLDQRRQLKQQVKQYEQDNTDILNKLKNLGDDIDPENNQYKKTEETEELYLERINELERTIQQWSRNRLREQYGISSGGGDGSQGEAGKLQFQFNMVHNADESSRSFMIETLSLEHVPHSTFVFHEMAIQRKRLDKVMPDKRDGTPCFTLQASKTTAPTWAESIRFREKSEKNNVTSSDYNVLIVRKGISPAVIFCAGKHESPGHDAEVETHFANVISGKDFVDMLINPSTPESTFKNWRVESIEVKPLSNTTEEVLHRPTTTKEASFKIESSTSGAL